MDEFHARLWTGHFHFYMSLPLERRASYRRLMKLYLPMLRTIETTLELHLNYQRDPDEWYLRRAEAIVPDVPGERSLAVARDTAYHLRLRELVRTSPHRQKPRARPPWDH